MQFTGSFRSWFFSTFYCSDFFLYCNLLIKVYEKNRRGTSIQYNKNRGKASSEATPTEERQNKHWYPSRTTTNVTQCSKVVGKSSNHIIFFHSFYLHSRPSVNTKCVSNRGSDSVWAHRFSLDHHASHYTCHRQSEDRGEMRCYML